MQRQCHLSCRPALPCLRARAAARGGARPRVETGHAQRREGGSLPGCTAFPSRKLETPRRFLQPIATVPPSPPPPLTRFAGWVEPVGRGLAGSVFAHPQDCRRPHRAPGWFWMEQRWYGVYFIPPYCTSLFSYSWPLQISHDNICYCKMSHEFSPRLIPKIKWLFNTNTTGIFLLIVII